MNDPKVFENPCPICKKREATQLCDYVVQYNLGITFVCDRSSVNRSHKLTKEATEANKYWTCDLPLCKTCAHVVGANADMCPHHYKLHLQADLPKHLRKYQMRLLQ